MRGRMNTELGEVVINSEVIAAYAGSIAVECFGIVGMAAVNARDGLVKLLRKDSMTHGISVKVVDNRIMLAFHIIIAYGVSISTVADNLMETVKYKVEEFTGMPVDRINIFVEGVRVID
ncbi:MAG: Asp23/Gls24 family envelope stress response protein [Lachnospiraceae bacterium]|nr:Asp23/Gls24 family envelope stress response protein [Lachnospiraceae bacterium]